ncbi:hydantoinase/oxoprolinase family protein [Pseudobacillus wudalianchiensis]|uniref:Methylhydantoinase n=1 Tax=Pseudobacillus wudalianchiensis TaxID=1743143 RepID=A0A1B9ADY4_9BACI|nr:hydantoinase/oxoprolinase family protein [Bacillus wudalianchiensis]OCA82044.1 methylhydantoinase [Bacillus wudalianchiensis]
MVRVGVDVGGTFTDLILVDELTNQIHVHKVPSTLEDQSIGVINGIQELCEKAGVPVTAVDYVLHGTTVATNITIERNGAAVGMLTTKNYRDILHIARHKKMENFSIQQDLPWQTDPLVLRRNRIPITEKLAAPDGRVKVPLNEKEVREAVQRLKDSNVDVVVISFLFSFLNDEHEQLAKKIVKEMWPEVQCFTSSEIVPQMREYERFSTAAMNAYVAPRVSKYLEHLVSALDHAGVEGELHIMQSSGGMATSEMATEKPVTLLKSGPSGAVLATAWCGDLEGVKNLISVDIGGTSADISVIPNGTPKIINPRDAEVNGYPVLVPMIDVEVIGAGGGSIAYIDAGGAFRVGPKSAGANPGPACYGQGGEYPCVTDANVILGRLDPEQFLGGDLQLHPELSYKAVEETLCRQLDMTVEEAALGILKIINNHMALCIRAKSVSKGIDPREFALFAAGGAGPLHSVDLAETIGCNLVIVPSYPGISAATGLLVGDLKYDFIKSHINRLDKVTPETMTSISAALETLSSEAQDQLLKDGVNPEDIVVERIAECRYAGQGFELRAAIPDGPITEQTIEIISKKFHEAHEEEYGHHFPENVVELITLRIVATGKTPSLALPKLEIGDRINPGEALMYERDTVFEVNGEIQRFPTPRYDRSKLLAQDVITGPAIIVQRDSTTSVPPHWQATVSENGTLFVAAKAAQGGAAESVEKLFSKVR